MKGALYAGGLLLALVGVAHSYLGERYILTRLFRREDLPKLFGSSDFTIRTLRFAWHVTSVAWWGFAAILILMAQSAATPAAIGVAIGCTFLAHALVVLVGSRGKHLAWPVFLVVGVIAILATRN